MSKNLDKEINEISEKMEKSTQTPKEKLFETIRNLGSEGIRSKIDILQKSEKKLLIEALSEMKKAVEMDSDYSSKYVEGNINDTILQEDKADDEEDEKLVKPEAAIQNHQGTPVEGWDGQVIKAKEVSKEEDKKIANKEAKKEVKIHEDKMHEEEVKKSEDPYEACRSAMEKGDFSEPKVKAALVKMKKTMEKKMGYKASPEMVKEEMKKYLKSKNKSPEMKKAFNWAPENDLLKACGNGQNHHFSINDYYDEVLKKPEEKLEKSKEKKVLNYIIEKSMDTTWDNLDCSRRLEENKKKSNGKIVKSFEENEIAQALGLSEEEAKKLLGE